MPYILQGTVDLISYWNTRGRPCDRAALARAVKAPLPAFIGGGRTRQSYSHRYGEAEAQNLASALGVEVSDVTDNGGQVLI